MNSTGCVFTRDSDIAGFIETLSRILGWNSGGVTRLTSSAVGTLIKSSCSFPALATGVRSIPPRRSPAKKTSALLFFLSIFLTSLLQRRGTASAIKDDNPGTTASGRSVGVGKYVGSDPRPRRDTGSGVHGLKYTNNNIYYFWYNPLHVRKTQDCFSIQKTHTILRPVSPTSHNRSPSDRTVFVSFLIRLKSDGFLATLMSA
ncbi:MAG: hypothetical protein PWP08_1545 [Methanofollis sp.]|nr:hypothetical protein [Methanofollis sp.]